MTLFEFVAVLGAHTPLPIPESIQDVEFVEDKDSCRYSAMNYFESPTFVKDTLIIMDQIIKASPYIDLNNFALTFYRGEDKLLHLELIATN